MKTKLDRATLYWLISRTFDELRWGYSDRTINTLIRARRVEPIPAPIHGRIVIMLTPGVALVKIAPSEVKQAGRGRSWWLYVNPGDYGPPGYKIERSPVRSFVRILYNDSAALHGLNIRLRDNIQRLPVVSASEYLNTYDSDGQLWYGSLVVYYLTEPNMVDLERLVDDVFDSFASFTAPPKF